jgi:hypothetical protein
LAGQNTVSTAHDPHRQWPVQPLASTFYGQPSPWPDVPNFEMMRILKMLESLISWNFENFGLLKILDIWNFENSGILKI